MKKSYVFAICMMLNLGATGLYATDDTSTIIKKADADFDKKDYLSAVAGYTLYSQNSKSPNIDYALYRIGEAKLKIAEYPERRMVNKYPKLYSQWKDRDMYLEYIDKNSEDFPAFEPAGSHIYSGREFQKLIELYPQSKYAAMGAYHLLARERIGDWEGTFPAAEFLKKDLAFLEQYPKSFFNDDVIKLAVSDYWDAICGDPLEGLTLTIEEKLGLKQEFIEFYKKMLPDLIKEVGGTDVERRSKAIAAIKKIGPLAKDAVPSLLLGLKGAEGLSRIDIATAIIDIDPTVKELLPGLLSELKNKDEKVRIRAIGAASYLNERGRDAVPALTEMLKDESVAVRRAVSRALERINNPKTPQKVDSKNSTEIEAFCTNRGRGLR